MNDASSMKVSHGLGNLTANVNTSLQGKRLSPDVEVGVQRTTFAETEQC